MPSLSKDERYQLRDISLRFDPSSNTYYCFYRRTDDRTMEITLSFDLTERQWLVETLHYKSSLERNLNDLFHNATVPFEEQIRYVIHYLDTYFALKMQDSPSEATNGEKRYYPLSWFRRLRGIRRCASQDVLAERLPVLQRYSAPEKLPSMNSTSEQIISVKALAEAFYTDELYRTRSAAVLPSTADPKKPLVPRLPKQAPPITEIWLNAVAEQMDLSREQTSTAFDEETLKQVAEKFVKHYGGTFQCDIGHRYQLNYHLQVWHFDVLSVQFMTSQSPLATKIPKTKFFFLIDGVAHCVRE